MATNLEYDCLENDRQPLVWMFVRVFDEIQQGGRKYEEI